MSQNDSPGRPKRTAPRLLKQSLLLFWAAWFSIVTLTNVMDMLKWLRVLDEAWPFASGNARFVERTLDRYGTLSQLTTPLFGAVIAWESLTACLFLRATWRSDRASVYHAFLASLALWMGFMLVDELCIAYDVEGTHLRLFVASLASLLAIDLLPDAV